MTLLEQLQSNKGGLIRLKTDLFWLDTASWDKKPGRICLILDTLCEERKNVHGDEVMACSILTAGYQSHSTRRVGGRNTIAQLLIDGSPQWVWVDEDDVEVISGH
jgi:hypothetical protein